MATKKLTFKNREEWLEARSLGIGASEVGTILGVNPWETPYQLWRRKKGLDAPKQENFAMKAGHYLEDAVSKFFSDETGAHIIQSSKDDFMYVNVDKPFLRVSPDRTFWREGVTHNEANKSILECKTTQMDIDSNEIPPYWYCQIQTNLGVAEKEDGALAWLCSGRKFGYADIRFDPDFYAYIKEKLEQFWTDYIHGEKEPPATTIDDVCLKFPRSIGKAVEVNDEVMAAVNEIRMLKPQLDELTKKKKELEDSIKTFMGDADTLCLQGTKETNPVVLATWKTAKDTLKFDEKTFAKEHEEAYNLYMKPVSGSRRFLMK